IAILAAILFPGFAQAREKARMSSCLSNARQIGTGLMMYVQDYDEAFPYCRFVPYPYEYVWRNAIRPYLKSLDVLSCPSNPYTKGAHLSSTGPPRSGDDAEGWQSEIGRAHV